MTNNKVPAKLVLQPTEPISTFRLSDMPSRRTHTKSRNGCERCKRRHIKCNLNSPTCSYCEKRGFTCSFSEMAGPVAVLSHRPAPSQPRTTAPSLPDCIYTAYLQYNASINPSLTIYCPSANTNPAVLLSFGLQDSYVFAWNPLVYQAIEQNIFLQYAFRALSILYNEGSNGRKLGQRPYIEACGDYLAASSNFQQSVKDPSTHNWIAVFLFSMAAQIFQLRMVNHNPGPSSISDTVQSLRNTAQFVRIVAPLFVQARYRQQETMHPPTQQAIYQAEDLKMMKYLDSLEADVKNFVGSRLESAAHCQAIGSLRQWMSIVKSVPRNWQHLALWPRTLCQEFINLLKADNQYALAITLSWCMLMKRLPASWHSGGWPDVLTCHARASIASPSVVSSDSYRNLTHGVGESVYNVL